MSSNDNELKVIARRVDVLEKRARANVEVVDDIAEKVAILEQRADAEHAELTKFRRLLPVDEPSHAAHERAKGTIRSLDAKIAEKDAEIRRLRGYLKEEEDRSHKLRQARLKDLDASDAQKAISYLVERGGCADKDSVPRDIHDALWGVIHSGSEVVSHRDDVFYIERLFLADRDIKRLEAQVAHEADQVAIVQSMLSDRDRAIEASLMTINGLKDDIDVKNAAIDQLSEKLKRIDEVKAELVKWGTGIDDRFDFIFFRRTGRHYIGCKLITDALKAVLS